MAKPKIYIDGQAGTTGLQIYERLAGRTDIELLTIGEERRKDANARRECLNAADLAILCLPDDAARDAAGLIEEERVKVIDCSTAHRTAEGWVYGLPELGRREQICTARRVANPGCHATGFLLCVAPLVERGMIPKDEPLCCWSLTGYSGGGKKMIAEYEAAERDPRLASPAPYAVGLSHKHLPEMQKVAGLTVPPAFLPVLGDIYQGMCTTVLLPDNPRLNGAPTAREVWALLDEVYRAEPLVEVTPFDAAPPRLYTGELAGLDRVRITVSGTDGQTLIAAQFDNLGKGASGAAVQNMNLMLGFAETAGLNL